MFKLILSSTLRVIRTYLAGHKDMPLLILYLQTGTGFLIEHVDKSQQRITEIREKNRGAVGLVLALAIFMEQDSPLHVLRPHLWSSSSHQVNMAKYYNISFTLLVICVTLNLHNVCSTTTFPEASAEYKRRFQK